MLQICVILVEIETLKMEPFFSVLSSAWHKEVIFMTGTAVIKDKNNKQ